MTFIGMHRHIFRSLTVAGIAAGSIFVVPSAASAHDSYVVAPGDTLSEIAEDAGVRVADLMAENELASPDRIRIGQKLSIPHADGSSHAPSRAVTSTSTYEVVSGDTLSQVAQRLGLSTAELADANDLSSPYRIRIGQELKVPTASAGASSVASYPSLPARLRLFPERQALIPIFERWSEANDLPVDLVMAVAWQESGWNSQAVSFKGAVGVGQIMPATGDWVAADLIGRPDLERTNAEDNIRMSARYLRWLIDYLGDEDLALAGYYQGPGAVRAGIMYEDTVQYVANVQVHRQFFVSS